MPLAILDYGVGNLFSVVQACLAAGLDARLVQHGGQTEATSAEALILPGVGAYGRAMRALQERNLDRLIYDFHTQRRPIIGICLGLQLLFESSSEGGAHVGLSLLEGEVRRLPDEEPGLKVPRVGWYPITPARDWSETVLAGAMPAEPFYFVHSYYACPKDPQMVLAWGEHGGLKYPAAIRAGHITAFQFHPEKSGPSGLEIYRAMALGLSRT